MRVAAGAEAERAAAEAYAAGAVGLEERGEGAALTLVLYAPAAAAEAVRGAVGGAGLGAAVGAAEPVPELDWPELWKRDLGATRVSARLVVRPSWIAPEPAPGRAELVIDPAQAFGTGAHESTRLALEWIDARVDALPAGARVLDVGCGSGVLALAALARAPLCAVACDLDPLAVEAARQNARRNGLSDRLAVFRGSVGALRAEAFELVVANLLRSELEPLLPGIARAVKPGGRVIVSGLLEAESQPLAAALAAVRLRPLARRERRDAGGALWCAWLTGR